MEINILYRLEKEIDRLFQVIGKLREENKLIKEKCEKLLDSQKEHKELIKLLKKENMGFSSASKNPRLEKEKEAKMKEGLKKILKKLDSLL